MTKVIADVLNVALLLVIILLGGAICGLLLWGINSCFFSYGTAEARTCYLGGEIVPLYRFWSPVLECHFYTVNEAEKAKLIEQYPHVWTYEDIACYVHRPPAEGQP